MEHRNKAWRDFSTASAFPAKAFPSRSIPARVSDRPASPRRSGPTTRQQPSGSPTSPSGIAARYPQTRLHFPTSAQDVPLHEERPALRRACSHYQGAPPTVSSSQEGPFPYFQRYSSDPEASASERKKKLRHLLSPVFPLPPFPGPCICTTFPASRQPTTGTGGPT